MLEISPSLLARDLIDKIGLKKSYASQLARGLKTPALHLAVKIECEIGIPPSFWIERQSSDSEPADFSHSPQHDNTGIASPHSGPVAGEVHSPEEVGE